MEAKIRKVDMIYPNKVQAGDIIGLGSATIGGPATGGQHQVPLVVVDGAGYRVVRVFKKFDHITDQHFPYAEVEGVA